MNANGLHKKANLLMCTAMAKNYIQNMTTETLRQVSNRGGGVSMTLQKTVRAPQVVEQYKVGR